MPQREQDLAIPPIPCAIPRSDDTIRDLEGALREAGITRLGVLYDAGTWAVTATTREGDSRDGYADSLGGALLGAVERVVEMRLHGRGRAGRADASPAQGTIDAREALRLQTERAAATVVARPVVQMLRTAGEIVHERALTDALLWGTEAEVEGAMGAACACLESLPDEEIEALRSRGGAL